MTSILSSEINDSKRELGRRQLNLSLGNLLSVHYNYKPIFQPSKKPYSQAVTLKDIIQVILEDVLHHIKNIYRTILAA